MLGRSPVKARRYLVEVGSIAVFVVVKDGVRTEIAKLHHPSVMTAGKIRNVDDVVQVTIVSSPLSKLSDQPKIVVLVCSVNNQQTFGGEPLPELPQQESVEPLAHILECVVKHLIRSLSGRDIYGRCKSNQIRKRSSGDALKHAFQQLHPSGGKPFPEYASAISYFRRVKWYCNLHPRKEACLNIINFFCEAMHLSFVDCHPT